MQAGRSTKIRNSLISAALLAATWGAVPAGGEVRGDFNGDGFSDLAIGVPNESVSGVHAAGAVNVIYGSPGGGLQTGGDQFFHQDSPGMAGFGETNDQFGYSLAAGDFNGDGFSDLAVGAIGEAVGAVADAGAVYVIYGSLFGLTTTGSQILHQDVGGVLDAAEPGDNFGFALAAGDFNADGYDELVAGIPGEGLAGLEPRSFLPGLVEIDAFGNPLFDSTQIDRAGAVAVFSGSPVGIVTAGNQLWHQEAQFPDLGSVLTGVPGTAWPGDELGASLAVGDYNGDGVEDLAIGIPGEGLQEYFIFNVILEVLNGIPAHAGAIHVLFSDWSGLTTDGLQLMHQDVLDTEAIAEHDDFFGISLASGDFNGDTFDDLAVGVASETIDRIPDPGGVHVFYGFHEGLIVEGDRLLHQDIDGVLGNAHDHDRFGFSLATGDFDADGFDDLAVGVPHDTINGVLGAGAVNVFYGQLTGISVERDQYWHQGVPFTPESLQRWDQFGHSLAVGDFDGDGVCDLAIGAFNEPVGLVNGAGVVHAFYGQFGVGLVTNGTQLWNQAQPSILGGAEPVDWFGFAVASGY